VTASVAAIPVFYDPRQTVVDDIGLSPSARKPAEVVASWQRLGAPIALIEPTPATVGDFMQAHDPAYVRGVLKGEIANGFGNTRMDVARSLPWTTGSLLSAASHAVQTGQPSASPTSGFHHARYRQGGGYCTFNGLMVTALALRKRGLVARVGILDLDMHYGNGTDDIIEHFGIDWITHYSFGGDHVERASSEEWLGRLPEIVQSFVGCGVILYQAGADPHVDDPLGGTLTTEQLARRDRIVFENVRALGIPVAWVLAGGYQKPLRRVLDIHDNTMRACMAAFAEVP